MTEDSDYQVVEIGDGTWRDDALCKGKETDSFFAEGAGGAGTVYLKARCLCFHCPVQKQCLDYAVDNSIFYGLWGGLAYRERLAYRSGKRSHQLTVLDVIRSSRRNDTVASIGQMLGYSEDEIRSLIRKAISK